MNTSISNLTVAALLLSGCSKSSSPSKPPPPPLPEKTTALRTTNAIPLTPVKPVELQYATNTVSGAQVVKAQGINVTFLAPQNAKPNTNTVNLSVSSFTGSITFMAEGLVTGKTFTLCGGNTTGCLENQRPLAQVSFPETRTLRNLSFVVDPKTFPADMLLGKLIVKP